MMNKLSKDTILNVFSFLSLRDLNNVSKVSKQWNQISKNDKLIQATKNRFLRKKPKQYQTLYKNILFYITFIPIVLSILMTIGREIDSNVSDNSSSSMNIKNPDFGINNINDAQILLAVIAIMLAIIIIYFLIYFFSWITFHFCYKWFIIPSKFLSRFIRISSTSIFINMCIWFVLLETFYYSFIKFENYLYETNLEEIRNLQWDLYEYGRYDNYGIV